MCEECKAQIDALEQTVHGLITALLMQNMTEAAEDGHGHGLFTQGQRTALTELLVMPPMPVGGGSRADKPLYPEGEHEAPLRLVP
jgi:hypothetical protein